MPESSALAATLLRLAQQRNSLKWKLALSVILFIPGRKKLLTEWVRSRNSGKDWQKKKKLRKRKNNRGGCLAKLSNQQTN